VILFDYALLVGAMGWVATRGRSWRIEPKSLEISLRALAVVLAAGFLALGMILLARQSPSALGAVMLVALTLGALVFLCGIGVWRGRTAQLCRAAGWGVMAAALAVPSTLSLALPLLVVLAPTLGPTLRPSKQLFLE
jgi:hypothetical protein